MFLCPVTGFCLSLAEQRSILRKYVSKEKQKSAMRRLHYFMMGNISSKTGIAKYVQKLLDKKYSKEISRCWNFDANKWMMEVDTFLNWEYFGAFIWISAMYKKLDEKDIERIMEKIHMYSHQMYYELQDAESELTSISEQLALMNEKYRNIRTKQKELAKELSVLKARNNQLTYKNRALENEIELLTKEHQNENDIAEKFIILEQQLKVKEKNIASLKTKNKQITKKASSQLSFFLEMKKDFDKILVNLKEQNEKCKKCDRVDLCEQRVLIVGGITKMETFYRKLIQELGGRFY